MIRVGSAGAPAGANSSEEGVYRVKELGLDAMEVEFVRGVRMGPETAGGVAAAAAETGVRLSVHAPYYVNLNSAEPEKIGASIGRVLKSLEIGDIFGATVVVVHAGFYSGDEKKKATADIRAAVQEIADKRAESGWKPLIGIECMGKENSWGKLDEIAEVSKVKGVVPVLDFAHHHAITQGGLKAEADFEEYVAWYEGIAKGPLHAHFSGINYGPKGELNHLPIDSGEPDYSKLVPVIGKRKYDITLISETPMPEKGAVQFKEMLG